MRPRWASKPRQTDRLIVGRNVTLTWQCSVSVWEGGLGGGPLLCCQSAYTERPIPPLIEEQTPLPSSDKAATHRQEGDHISLLQENRLKEHAFQWLASTSCCSPSLAPRPWHLSYEYIYLLECLCKVPAFLKINLPAREASVETLQRIFSGDHSCFIRENSFPWKLLVRKIIWTLNSVLFRAIIKVHPYEFWCIERTFSHLKMINTTFIKMETRVSKLSLVLSPESLISSPSLTCTHFTIFQFIYFYFQLFYFVGLLKRGGIYLRVSIS
jgi:hypothetical protein